MGVLLVCWGILQECLGNVNTFSHRYGGHRPETRCKQSHSCWEVQRETLWPLRMVFTVGIPAASAFQSWPPNSKSSSLPVSNSHEDTSHWISVPPKWHRMIASQIYKLIISPETPFLSEVIFTSLGSQNVELIISSICSNQEKGTTISIFIYQWSLQSMILWAHVLLVNPYWLVQMLSQWSQVKAYRASQL